jgi:hypothetical protein
MAYVTTQFIENLQVENLIFIPANNEQIPEGYALFINGEGQTYWASLDDAFLSSFSTSVYASISSLQTQIFVQSTINQNQSTSISSLNGQFNQLSTSLSYDFSTMYHSTIVFLYSTLNSFSSFSSFYTQFDALEKEIQSGLSSLSTALYIQNTSTYTSLLNINNSSFQSSIAYTNSTVGNLSSIVAYKSDLSTFSSVITSQLLSTIAYIPSLISTANAPLYASISMLTVSTQQNNSTSQGLQQQITALQITSTNTSNVVNFWINRSLSTSQSLQDISTYGTIGSLSSLFASTQNNNIIAISSLTSTVNSFNSAIVTTTNTVNLLNIEVDSLSQQFSSITQAGILLGIYDSFIQLEQLTNALIISTFSSITTFQNAVLYSTAIQNTSTAAGYFDFYVSTLYLSTLSTLIPLTSTAVSTLTAAMFSTSQVFYCSSLLSTTNAYANTVLLSTNTSLFNQSLSSLEGEALSSYNGYLTTLNTNSTINLHDDTYVGILDFVNYRNFEINVYNLQNITGSNYRLQYDPSGLTNMDYSRGIIFINISTPSQTYTQNDGKLEFDVYRWGVPTTFWGNFFPTIGDSQYTLEYEYTILHTNVYTNLVNVYPLLYVQNLTVGEDSGEYTIFWTNYNGFNPDNLPGAPVFDPTVMLETSVNSVKTVYGPFPFNSSKFLGEVDFNTTVTVRITGQQDPTLSKTIVINEQT